MKRTRGDEEDASILTEMPLPVSERPLKKARKASADADPNFYRFKSDSPDPERRVLSNFSDAGSVTIGALDVTDAMRALCPDIESWLDMNGEEVLRFPTSEHAWQALSKADSYTTLSAFFVGDEDLGQYGPTLYSLAGCKGKAAKKGERRPPISDEDAWKKNDAVEEKGRLGLLAKMAVTNKTLKKALGLELRADRKEGETLQGLAEATLKAAWHDILKLKFTQNVEPRRVLLEVTGSRTLVEFDKAAFQKGGEGAYERCFWGGADIRGVLHGRNMMGTLLMELRDELRQEETARMAAAVRDVALGMI